MPRAGTEVCPERAFQVGSVSQVPVLISCDRLPARSASGSALCLGLGEVIPTHSESHGTWSWFVETD